MKVLLDECCPRPLSGCLTGAEFFTVEMVGLKGVKNGALIRAADGEFAVLITADKNLRHEQNLTGRTVAIIELPFNSWKRLRAMLPVIQAAVLSGAADPTHRPEVLPASDGSDPASVVLGALEHSERPLHVGHHGIDRLLRRCRRRAQPVLRHGCAGHAPGTSRPRPSELVAGVSAEGTLGEGGN